MLQKGERMAKKPPNGQEYVSVSIYRDFYFNNNLQLPTMIKEYPPLKNIIDTNLLICESCHHVFSNKFSHQAHFRAKLGANIPSEYPRLPNSQISCLTCHLQHASKKSSFYENQHGAEIYA